MTLMEYLASAKESLFRFEYLQKFNIPNEKEDFEIYLKTGHLNLESMEEWWSFLKSLHDNGIETQRVRLVRKPQSRYVDWELAIHKEAIKQGDEIRILAEERMSADLETLGDFWIVDDVIALHMKYNHEGNYLGFEIDKDIDKYLIAKDYCLISSNLLG